uniref:Ribosomal protein L14 n=1 Tax=Malawimonas californiana TaxID=221722 RepID=A0A0B5GSE9_MALCL|nr:ribosomal protein L14 [Malawimonas californiana]AJF22880.1 ribosomal protein L14 [Malawimonas californiana]
MISTNTLIKVFDNSGAKIAQCIKVFKKSKKNDARVGDIIVVSVKKALVKKKINKGQVVLGLIIRTRRTLNRKNGNSIKYNENAIIIVNKLGIPVGTRIIGPVSYELRVKKMMKVLSIASSII